MGFTPVDFAVVMIYLVGVTLFGSWLGKRQRSTKDYFLGDRNLPWTAVSFSVVATETSTLTFISIPGLAYVTNLNFLQLTFGYLIGRIIISFVLIPAYYKGEMYTAYEFLGRRFGPKLRNFASVVFQITRLLADGVRLFATAIPLSIITGWSYPLSIAVIGVLTIIYTYIGGIKAVVWIDVIQMFIYLGGALVAGIFILQHLPGGWSDVVQAAVADHKFSVFHWGFENGLRGFFNINYTVIGGILGGAFLSMASHGTDQLIVQRLLTCKNVRDSQKALISSGVLVIFQFALFLIVGLMLYAYYQGQVIGANSEFLTSSDQLFPKFIVEALPPGLSGVIIAGIFAAAMSTLSGSLNSLASSTMLDLYKPHFGQNNSPQKDLMLSRIITAVWGVVFIGGAMLFKDRNNPVVELGLAIASFTYGGLLGTFFLGLISKRVRENAALISMWATIYFMTWIVGITGVAQTAIIFLNVLIFAWLFWKSESRKQHIAIVAILVIVTTVVREIPSVQFAWPWYVLVGCVITIVLGILLDRFINSGRQYDY